MQYTIWPGLAGKGDACGDKVVKNAVYSWMVALQDFVVLVDKADEMRLTATGSKEAMMLDTGQDEGPDVGRGDELF